MIEPILELAGIIVIAAIVCITVLGLAALGFGIYLVVRALRKLSRYLGWVP